MSPAEAGLLMWTAASLAAIHALIGVDHTVPFVALARTRGWCRRRTLLITAAAGLGHVAASAVPGIACIALGLSVERLEPLALVRGSLATGLMVGFGLAWAAWGTWRALRHEHHAGHVKGGRLATGWLLVVLVVGPCEALIPLMMVPAAARDWPLLAAVLLVFALVTIATMTLAVATLLSGLRLRVPAWLPRWSDAAAGLAVATCGLAVATLGL